MQLIEKIIDKFEKYLQLDLRSYVKNTSYLMAVNVISIICGLATSIAFTRLTSKEVYGQFGFIMSVVGVFAIFSLPGMDTSIVQAAANGYDKIFSEGTKTRFKWSFIGSGSLIVTGVYYYFIEGSSLLAVCFFIATLFFPAFFVLESYSSFLRGKKQFNIDSEYRSISLVASALVTIAVIYYFRDLKWIVFGSMASASLMNLYFFTRISKKQKMNNEMDEGAISYGKHLTLAGVIFRVRAHYDKIIIAGFLGFAEVAIYSIARVFAEQIYNLVKNVGHATFPDFAILEKKDAYLAIKKRLFYVFLGIGLISVVGIILVPYFIPLLFTLKYTESILYAQLFFIIVIPRSLAILFYMVLQAQKETQTLYKINFGYAISEIILLSVLVPSFGLMGLVVSKGISNSIYLVLCLWGVK